MQSVVVAYGFIWIAVCGYVFFVHRKQQNLEREVKRLKEMLPR